MRLLLDTHAVLWMLNAPERLSPAAKRELTSPAEPPMVSAISAYEVAQRRFQVPAFAYAAGAFRELVDSAGLTWTPLTPGQAYAAGRLAWAHRDPFDRMLAAQALDLDATLVTADAELRAFRDVRTLW